MKVDRFVTGDGCGIAYRFDGAQTAPLLLLSNSLGTIRAAMDNPTRPQGAIRSIDWGVTSSSYWMLSRSRPSLFAACLSAG